MTNFSAGIGAANSGARISYQGESWAKQYGAVAGSNPAWEPFQISMKSNAVAARSELKLVEKCDSRITRLATIGSTRTLVTTAWGTSRPIAFCPP